MAATAAFSISLTILASGHPSTELVGSGLLHQCGIDSRTIPARTDGPTLGSGLPLIWFLPKPRRFLLARPLRVAGMGAVRLAPKTRP